jgi:thiol-disulfide isomerase/thioredoxin
MQNPIKRSAAGIVAALAASAAITIALPAVAADPSGPAPQFTLPEKGGGQLNLAQYKGQVVMINFWASWCGPCRQEMPLLEDIYKKYNKLGFTLIGVNVEPDSKAADDWLKATPVTFPVGYDKDSKVSQMFKVSGMPTTVIIDRKGNVRYRHISYKPGDEGEYLNTIRAMIRE